MLIAGLTMNHTLRGEDLSVGIIKAAGIVVMYTAVLAMCRGIPDELGMLFSQRRKQAPPRT